MNWRRGLLRLWLVASLLWISFVGWAGYQRLVQLSCFDKRKANPSLGNPLRCLPEAGYPNDYLPGHTAADLIVWALAPVVVFILGLIVAWIVAGFKSASSRQNS